VVALRTAGPRDAASLAEFAARSFRESFGAANRDEDMAAHCEQNFSPERQRSEIDNPDWYNVLAEQAGELAGFAQLRTSPLPDCVRFPTALEIYRFYVAPAYHGTGLAHRLMNALLDRAASQGADAVWLGVWEHNPRAIAFYRKSGFHPVGEQAFVLGRDIQRDVVMLRALHT
jgi:diamine N-acetyltransferase